MRTALTATVLFSLFTFSMGAQQQATTPVEFSAEITDTESRPIRDLQPQELIVVEEGMERRVTNLQFERDAQQTDRSILICIDFDLTSRANVLASLRALAEQASTLTALGSVDVVVAKPEVQWIARNINDPQTLAKTLKDLESIPANDKLVAWRNDVPKNLFLKTAERVVELESDIFQAFRERMPRILSSASRRPFSVMLLVTDGFDLNPVDFYQQLMTHLDEAKILRAATDAKQRPLQEAFARTLGQSGWTIFAISPEGRNSLAATVAPTGGRVTAPNDLPRAIASIHDRLRVTYTMPRPSHLVSRPIELKGNRAGMVVAMPSWSSPQTTEAIAAMRAREQFGQKPGGELPITLRLQLDEGQERTRRATGGLEARLGMNALAPIRSRLDRGTLRVTIAVESENAPENIIHHLIHNYDLTQLQRVLFTAPMQIEPVVRRVSVVIEELSSGKWGGTWLELPAASKERLYASANFEETKRLIEPAPIAEDSDGLAWMTWEEGLVRARAEGKLIFVRIDSPAICFGCDSPNSRVYRHAAFRRHMESNYVPVRVDRALAREIGISMYMGVADPWGAIRFSWEPKTPVELASRLSVVKQYSQSLLASGEALHANADSADAQFMLGWVYMQTAEFPYARLAYAKAQTLAQQANNTSLLERIETHLALIDARTDHRENAKPALEKVIANTKNDLNAAEALLVLGHLYRAEGDTVKSADAFSRAAALAPKGSELESSALALTGADVAPVVAGEDGDTRMLKPAQLIRPRGAVIAGRVELQTLVRDARVAEVRFFVDDKQLASDRTPPFTARVALDPAPRPHALRIQAFTREGQLLGEDTLRVNERHDELAVRIVSPREGNAEGKTRVELDVQRPAQAKLARVELYWNASRLATLRQPPFVTDVTIPNESGYVRAVAVLSDGRTAEDAVTLNVGGYTQSIDVAVAEIYARVTDAKGKPITTLTKRDFTVLEKGVRREIERVQYVDRPPLLIGLALDTSGSMAEAIFDVHVAAQEFLRNAFSRDARAFLIGFDETPRLVHETTNELRSLTKQIDDMHVQGATTVLFDAIMFSLLQFEGTSGKKALIVVSDADDRSSRYSSREVADFARRAGVAVYPILLNPKMDNLRPVASMAARTGGKVFSIRNTRNLDAIYREIDAQLGGQYIITLAPAADQQAGELRTVDVRVSAPEATVQATPGYEVR